MALVQKRICLGIHARECGGVSIRLLHFYNDSWEVYEKRVDDFAVVLSNNLRSWVRVYGDRDEPYEELQAQNPQDRLKIKGTN